MISTDHEQMRLVFESWLTSKLPGAESLRVAPLRLPRGAGNSAETLFADASYSKAGERKDESFVLRIQNEGSDLFLNASLKLPWNMMTAMAGRKAVPVPELIGIEQDRSLFGAPFLVMRQAKGRMVPQNPNYNLSGWLVDLPPSRRREVWTNGIKMMAEIHKIDWHDGFTFLDNPERGKPGLEQLIHWTQEWFDWTLQGRANPICEEAMRQLRERMPNDTPVQVLWGDPGTHNLLFNDDLSISTVLDWEVGALGPGEADLGWWLFFDDMLSTCFGVTRCEGLPDCEETIAIYEQAAGRKVEHIDYYRLLAELRMSLVITRTYDRHVAKGTIPDDPSTITHTPLTQLMARRLGMPVPDISPAFLNMVQMAQRD